MTNDLLGGCRSPPLGERPRKQLPTRCKIRPCETILHDAGGMGLPWLKARASPSPGWSPLGSTSRRPCRPCACALRCAPQLRQQQRPAQRPGCHLGRVGAAVSLAGCCCLAACRHIVRAPRPPAAALTRVGPPALRCARVPLCRRAPPCRAGRARPALRRKETKRARPFVQAAARLHKSPVLYRCRPFWGCRAEVPAPQPCQCVAGSSRPAAAGEGMRGLCPRRPRARRLAEGTG